MPEQGEKKELVSLATTFDEAWNNHDADKVLSLFTEDAVVKFVMDPVSTGDRKFPPDQLHCGKDQIREFVSQHMPGFHVESKGHEIAGDKIVWTSTFSDDFFKKAGLERVQGMAEAVVKAGKFESFTVTPSPESAARLKSAIAPKA